MGGSEIFGPLLRAGLVDLDQCSEAVKKRWCIFQVFLPPKLTIFLGEGPFPRIEGPFQKLRAQTVRGDQALLLDDDTSSHLIPGLI